MDEQTRGESATFNPGRLVGRVLGPVLEAAERSLPAGEFPPQELTDRFNLRAVPLSTQVELEARFGPDAARYRRALELHAPQAAELPPGIAAALGLPVPGEAAAPQPPVAAEPEPVAVERDEFDRWAAGDPLGDDDLNRWRRAVYEAVRERVEQDAVLAPVADDFRRTSIRFEGQLAAAPPADVRLDIPREARAAVALRALVRSPAEVENWRPWVDEQAERVRSQLRERLPVEEPVPAAPELPTVPAEVAEPQPGTAEVAELPTVPAEVAEPPAAEPEPVVAGPRQDFLCRCAEGVPLAELLADPALIAWLQQSPEVLATLQVVESRCRSGLPDPPPNPAGEPQ